MKVHIVTDRLSSDRILPRLAKYLSVYNGWSISESPDQCADFNYFNNYCTWHKKCRGWHATPTAAYFSHLDTQSKTKTSMWYEAAAAVDLCVTTADMYNQFCPEKKLRKAHPAVETDRFIIQKRPNRDKPVIGVTGFTYGDGRKGEKLFEQLCYSELAKKTHIRASGRGWTGVRCEYHEWKNMPQYISSLDVLLVPSLVEGVPMPPLEALACGVKVVVPSHVGLIDELPDIDGIYRYECGNVKSMLAAIEQAVFSGDVDRDALRKIITSNYTVQHWADDHKRIVDEFFNIERIEVENLPDWQGNSGVYMVAFGEPSRNCAKRCIDSVRNIMPELPICLVAESPIGGESVFVKHPDSDAGGRIAKLKVNELAPQEWKYVLYLDADTELVDDISALFNILQDGWELVICKDNNKYGTVREMKRPDNLDECAETWDVMGSQELLQYNGGMIAYRRNNRTDRFFKSWQKEWDKYGKRDQGALLRSLYNDPLRIFVLMNQFNASTRYKLPNGLVSILHHNTEARRWKGIIPGRIDSKEAMALCGK